MKIALILTGHFRCWKDVYPNFKQTVLDPYKPDVFIDTWDEEGWWVPSDKQTVTGYYDNTPKLDQQAIIEHYNPKSIVVENWETYNKDFEERGKQYSNFAHRPKNILSMFYKMHKGVQLMEEYSSRTDTIYDFVFRMRPDMIFESGFPSFDARFLYTLPHRNHMGQGTGDMFQAGSMINIIMFSKIACFLPAVYQRTNLLCPHVMSIKWIQDLNIPWQEVTIPKRLQHTPKGQYIEVDE